MTSVTTVDDARAFYGVAQGRYAALPAGEMTTLVKRSLDEIQSALNEYDQVTALCSTLTRDYDNCGRLVRLRESAKQVEQLVIRTCENFNDIYNMATSVPATVPASVPASVPAAEPASVPIGINIAWDPVMPSIGRYSVLRHVPLKLNSMPDGNKRYEPSVWNKNEVVWEESENGITIRAPNNGVGVDTSGIAILSLTIHYQSDGNPVPKRVIGYMWDNGYQYRIVNSSIKYA